MTVNVSGNHIKKVLLLVCTGMMLLPGCTKRYWYRTKIDMPRSNKYSVKINIVNQNPELLSPEFVSEMHKAAASALRKKGYFETNVKSPSFVYTLTLKVDTFNRAKKYYDYNNVPHTSQILAGHYNYKFGVSAIEFVSQLDYARERGMKWQKFYDIYFFAEKRDVNRSKGVVKFLIKTAEARR